MPSSSSDSEDDEEAARIQRFKQVAVSYESRGKGFTSAVGILLTSCRSHWQALLILAHAEQP